MLIEYHKCIYAAHIDYWHTRIEFPCVQRQQQHRRTHFWKNVNECAKNVNNNWSQVNIAKCQLHSWLLMILLEIEHKLLTSNIDVNVQHFEWIKKRVFPSAYGVRYLCRITVHLCCVIYCQSIGQFYCSNYIQRRLSASLTQSFFVCIACHYRRRRPTADEYSHTLTYAYTHSHMHYIFKLISHEMMFLSEQNLCSGAYGHNIF